MAALIRSAMAGLGFREKLAATLDIHPYYPPGISLPGWKPVLVPYNRLIAGFFAFFAVLAAAAWGLTSLRRSLGAVDRLILIWFLSCFIIHTIIEGAVVIDAKFYTGASGSVFSEIWKEYGKADSRYLTRDAFTVCMEAFTAFVEGPCCLAIVYGILQRAPWRDTLEILVSFGELYGNILYLGTSFYEGNIYCRPEPFYFWFYLIFMNAIWIVVPILVIGRAAMRISRCVSVVERASEIKIKER